MIFFEYLGIIAFVILGAIFLYKLYRRIFPNSYSWGTCPNDHDTMARYGVKKCEKCNNKL